MKVTKLFFGVCLAAFAFSGCQKKSGKSQDYSGIESYSRSNSATSKIEGAAVPYCIWYNPEKWMITSTPFYSDDKEKREWDWILVLMDPENRKNLSETTPTRGSLALVYSDAEKKRSDEEIKKRVQESLLKGKNLEEFEDMGSDERIVNGLKVFAWKFKTKLPDMGDRIFYNYYYSGPYGSVSLVTLTNLADWDKNKQDVEDLLNGLCIHAQKKG